MVPVTFSLDDIISGYILIDAVHLAHIPGYEGLPVFACIPHDLTNIANLMPVLLEIATLSADQLQTLSQIINLQEVGASPPMICAILISNAGIKEIAEQIAKFLSAIDEMGSPVYWRFFDPRVFSMIWSLFSAEQRCALLGPIRQWRFPWCGHWWVAQEECEGTDYSLEIVKAFPTHGQWSMIKLSRQVDQILQRVKSEMNIQKYEWGRLQMAAIKLLTEASETLHLTADDEMIDFAFMIIKYGQNFRSHPEFIVAVGELSSGKLRWFSFKKRLDAIPRRAFENQNF